jgi:hypothetical protein
MLTYVEVLRRSLKSACLLLAADAIISFLPFWTRIDLSRIGVVGDLLLVEVAGLFIGAGILDITSSVGMAGFRKLFSLDRMNTEYSPAKRREAERHAMVFLLTGSLLLVAMILLATYDLLAAALNR